MTTFYRLHANEQAPCFCADHAHSGVWGGEWNADGSATRCGECDGTGNAYGETCPSCQGEGWDEATPGYSACYTAAELIAYAAEHIGGVDPAAPVVIFEGRQVGTGFDGEPLVVPTGDIRWTTWAALAQS